MTVLSTVFVVMNGDHVHKSTSESNQRESSKDVLHYLKKSHTFLVASESNKDKNYFFICIIELQKI